MIPTPEQASWKEARSPVSPFRDLEILRLRPMPTPQAMRLDHRQLRIREYGREAGWYNDRR